MQLLNLQEVNSCLRFNLFTTTFKMTLTLTIVFPYSSCLTTVQYSPLFPWYCVILYFDTPQGVEFKVIYFNKHSPSFYMICDIADCFIQFWKVFFIILWKSMSHLLYQRADNSKLSYFRFSSFSPKLSKIDDSRLFLWICKSLSYDFAVKKLT